LVRKIDRDRRFEGLAFDLSSALTQAPPEAINREIDRSIKRIVFGLGIDRSALSRIVDDGRSVRVTHYWSRPGIEPPPGDLVRLLPWYSKTILGGGEVIYSNQSELPPEAAEDVARLGPAMPRSHVGLPLRVGSTIVGAIGFATFRNEYAWDAPKVRRLRFIAEIFSNALERQRVLEEQVKMRRQLIEVSQVAAMGELTAAIVHEINQPLTAILSNAEAAQTLLEAEKPDLTEVKAAIADIVDDDLRVAEIVKRLRNLFIRGELNKAPLDLSDAIGEIAPFLKKNALLHKTLFEISVDESIPPIAGDQMQLQHAIVNIVHNALEAVSELPERLRRVLLTARTGKDGWVEVAVKDSGLGIRPDVLPRVFDRFYSTKKSGMGIGLAISKSIVDAHDGTLVVASSSGMGTVFEMRLPAKPRDHGAIRMAGTP